MCDQQTAVLGIGADRRDGCPGDIDKFVHRWDEWEAFIRASDYENYADGNIKLSFEFVSRGRDRLADSARVGRVGSPDKIACVLAERHVSGSSGEVGNLFFDNVAGQCGVVCHWDQEPVLVESIESFDEVEKLVPSRFTVWLEVNEGIEESLVHPVGQSVLYGFVKPVGVFAERELDIPLFPGRGSEGANNFPIGVVERGSELMDCVGTAHRGFSYDGFVLFGSRGALAGLCVCFEDIGEGSMFAEQIVKIGDVFRGPFNLE